MKVLVRTGLGQDSHRFLEEGSTKPCVIGSVVFEGVPGFKANSDGDVAIHALCNAISSVTGVIILGKIADQLCEKGITNSDAYLKEAIKTLGNQKITHVSFSFEGMRPIFLRHIPQMRKCIAEMLAIAEDQVGITATSGEGLTDFGRGKGVQCLCIVTTVEEVAL